MNTLLNAINGIANGIGPFLLLLGLLIFVHELGHFLVAKYFKVRVETFSLGFGKKILQHKRGDTNYCISIIPLGGYVKMFGDDPTKEISDQEKQYSFLHKPVLQRIAIVLAGPLMNLAFAYLIFVAIGLIGEPQLSNQIGDVASNSRAYSSGFRSGDRIVSINGETTKTWNEVKTKITTSINQTLEFDVVREESGQTEKVSATPVIGENDNILSQHSQVGVIEGLDPLSYAPMIGINSPNSPAARSGLQSLEVIAKVNAQDIKTWRQLVRVLQAEINKGSPQVLLQVQTYGDDDKPESRELTLELKGLKDFHQLGIEKSQLYLWKVKRGSPADRASLKSGDRMIAVNNQPVEDWSQVIDSVKKYNPDLDPPVFTVQRGGELITAAITPELTEMIDHRGKDERRFTIGIVSGMMQSNADPVISSADSLGQALKVAVTKTWESNTMIVMSIAKLIQGDVSAKNIGGIISIGRFANQSYDAGLVQFLKMMALISINLFLLNLLPVPVLDGGHLVFFTIEALKGTPLSMRKMEIAQTVGLVLLMSLMVFSLFNDISNWLNSHW